MDPTKPKTSVTPHPQEAEKADKKKKQRKQRQVSQRPTQLSARDVEAIQQRVSALETAQQPPGMTISEASQQGLKSLLQSCEVGLKTAQHFKERWQRIANLSERAVESITKTRQSDTRSLMEPDPDLPEHAQAPLSTSPATQSSVCIPGEEKKQTKEILSEIKETVTEIQEVSYTAGEYFQSAKNIMDKTLEEIDSIDIEESAFGDYQKIIKEEIKHNKPRLEKCLALTKRLYLTITFTESKERGIDRKNTIKINKLSPFFYALALSVANTKDSTENVILSLISIMNLSHFKRIASSLLMGAKNTLAFADLLNKYLYEKSFDLSTRFKVASLIETLCDLTEEKNRAAQTPDTMASSAELNTLRYKAKLIKNEATSTTLIPLLIHLINHGCPEYLFDLVRYVTNAPPVSDDEMTQIINCVRVHHSEAMATALSALFEENYEVIDSQDTHDGYLLWLKAAIAMDRHDNPDNAEQLLIQAAEACPRLWLEVAQFYLEQNPSPEKTLCENVKTALQKARNDIPETERDTWQEYLSLITLLESQLPEETAPLSEAAASAPDTVPGDDSKLLAMEGIHISDSTVKPTGPSLPPVATASPHAIHDTAPAQEEKPSGIGTADSMAGQKAADDYAYLSNVMPLIRRVLQRFQPASPITQPGQDVNPSTPFITISAKGKKLDRHETMRYENRSFHVNRLLRNISQCRLLNDVNREYRLIEAFLFHPSAQCMIGYERILHELIWSIIQSVDEPHRGSFKATTEEKNEALHAARTLTLVCMEHTMKQDVRLDLRMPKEQIIEAIIGWLGQADHFNNNHDIEAFMRFNLRCLAGSTLGHIYSLMAQNSKMGAATFAEIAHYYFNAKHKIQPSYTGKTEENENDRRGRSRYVKLRAFNPALPA